MRNILLLLLTLVFACSPSKSDEIKLIKKQALDIHDEVMPKMGELRRARKDLMLRADSLMEKDSVRAQQLLNASNEIANANESMMNWMRNFEPEFEGSEEEMLDYFKKQKESIEIVKFSMSESLTKGKEMIE